MLGILFFKQKESRFVSNDLSDFLLVEAVLIDQSFLVAEDNLVIIAIMESSREVFWS